MQRSKIVLGLGALLLAGAGAFAAATSHTATQVFYRVSAESPCVSTQIDFSCDLVSIAPCLGEDNTSPSLNKQLYANDICTQPLKKP